MMMSLSSYRRLAQGLSKNMDSARFIRSALGTAARRSFSAQAGGTTKVNDTAVKPVDGEEFDEDFDEEDLLEGKASGDILRKAFSERSAAAMRFEYFAQRAELEAEMEAASALRSMTETAKQQALGFLELIEEYGTHSDSAGAVQVGTTLDNVAACAVAERSDVERYGKHAEQASTDGIEELAEWYSDMSDASSRTADRLELVSSLMDAEYEGMEDDEEGEADGEDSEHSSGPGSKTS
jgi:rubrerythrin